ncbi:DIS3-like exonuclease [Raphidocelis subcapitata]|uniref:DIS3-like exonuclease n=1 Tax=Raphidocelis subcapitata TaxID=307507 RepID=A0A2V0NMF3_9CHLO|nr:DIS3-like exonuclease [Raphidocelis subcapitata]|eukprot:GBF88688.1 DIS3-like exonuclease [Raphidocelis subcapitata]
MCCSRHCKLRVNATNRSEAFCTLEGLPSDLMVRGERAQNRGIDGDEAAVEVLPLGSWFCNYRERDQMMAEGRMPPLDQDPFARAAAAAAAAAEDAAAAAVAQRPWTAAGSREGALAVIESILRARPDMRATGRVVAVLAPSPKRDAMVGVLLPLPAPDGQADAQHAQQAAGGGRQAEGRAGAGQGVQLVPLDPRLPRCVVTAESLLELPEDIGTEPFRPDVQKRTFICAALQPWPEHAQTPSASARRGLGRAGDTEGGTEALLAASAVRTADFSDEVLACLPAAPWRVAGRDLEERRDMRSWRIFSIDPITARDLDDALSIEQLPPQTAAAAGGAAGPRWRVGVHIADVASFVAPGTALDKEALARGTSTYLVQRVVPMLPRLLCEQLCSLNPGEERFAFSLVWELDDEGNVLDEWAGRSVILSRGKLAYPMVQQMIEGAFDPERWGVQLHGGATWEEVEADSLSLHAIARRLRARRFAGGALRLDNTRLFFTLDAEGQPVAAAPYVQQEANQLVEEFMLLANMRVAKLISDAFPEHALLRCHPFPNERKMKELQAAAKELGVELDVTSAGALQSSLAALRAATDDPGTGEVLTLLATKPMQLAQYFCTAGRDRGAWAHYALAVQLYTHFTSPIRRYPDILVHRLLAAALALKSGAAPSPAAALAAEGLPDGTEMQRMADHSNDTRKAARDVQDGSLKLFLAVMMRHSPVVAEAVVTGVGGASYFSAYLPEFGTEVRITLSEAGLAGDWDKDLKIITVTEDAAAAAAAGGQQQLPDGGGGGGGGGTPGGFGRSSSGGGWRRGGGSGGGRGPPSRSGSGSGALGGGGGGAAAAADPDASVWEAALARLRNPHGLAPLRIPTEVRLFSHVPVVIGACISQLSGHPMDIGARVFTPAVAAAAAAEAAAEAAGGAAAAGAGAAAALGAEEEARGGLHLGVLVDAMFDD